MKEGIDYQSGYECKQEEKEEKEEKEEEDH
jgi:hypothetical protein